MGFSTSGSLLIIFFGVFIALGSVYTAASNTTEEVADGYGDLIETRDEIERTAVNVTEAVYHETEGNLTIRVDNTGSTTLSVAATDAFVDGAYRSGDGFEIATVDGNGTDIWDLQQELRLENDTTRPDRVKVVTGVGIADTATVTPMGINRTNPRTLDRTSNGTESTISFDLTSSYHDNVTLLDVTVESVTGESVAYYEYTRNASLAEVNISQSSDPATALTTVDGNFTLGETVGHDAVDLSPNGELRYIIGEFRASTDSPVDMPNTEVTITITYEDPHGVERTFTFTEGRF